MASNADLLIFLCYFLRFVFFFHSSNDVMRFSVWTLMGSPSYLKLISYRWVNKYTFFLRVAVIKNLNTVREVFNKLVCGWISWLLKSTNLSFLDYYMDKLKTARYSGYYSTYYYIQYILLHIIWEEFQNANYYFLTNKYELS